MKILNIELINNNKIEVMAHYKYIDETLNWTYYLDNEGLYNFLEDFNNLQGVNNYIRAFKVVNLFINKGTNYYDLINDAENLKDDFLTNINSIDIINYIDYLISYAEDYYDRCEACGEVYFTEDMYYLDDYYIINSIESAINNNYFDYIEMLGIDAETIKDAIIDSITYEEGWYCENCDSDMYGDIIGAISDYNTALGEDAEADGCYGSDFIKNIRHSYHYSKDKIKDLSNNNLSLGFECELEFDTNLLTENDKNILLKYADDLFYYEKDGSLSFNGGLEAVTNIISLDYLFKREKDFKEFFSIKAINNSSNCGGHLHIGLNYIKSSALNQIQYFFKSEKDLLKAISGRSRFGYCSFKDKALNNYQYEKFTAIHLKEETLEFRFWNNYKSWESMVRRAVISIAIIKLANKGTLNKYSLLDKIKEYDNKIKLAGYNINFNWYYNKFEEFI